MFHWAYALGGLGVAMGVTGFLTLCIKAVDVNNEMSRLTVWLGIASFFIGCALAVGTFA